MLAAGPAGGQINPVRTAPLRLRIAKIGQGDWPAKVGVAEMAPCGNAPGRFRSLYHGGQTGGVPNHLGRLRRTDPGLFRHFQRRHHLLYLFWQRIVRGGRRLETGSGSAGGNAGLPRRSANQHRGADGPLLNSASAPAGRDYVPNIFLGVNPFGPSTNYVANFTAVVHGAQRGPIHFCHGLRGCVLAGGGQSSVAAWFGNHGAEQGGTGNTAGRLRSPPGCIG